MASNLRTTGLFNKVAGDKAKAFAESYVPKSAVDIAKKIVNTPKKGGSAVETVTPSVSTGYSGSYSVPGYSGSSGGTGSGLFWIAAVGVIAGLYYYQSMNGKAR